jgi:Zn-dependent protease with chaperone function
MGRRAAECILHGIVAASVVMMLLRAQRIRAPQARLRFWLLAMGLPLAGTPLLWLLAPWRLGERFRDEWALFSASHLSPWAWHGVELATAAAWLLALAGAALFLRDVIPFALDFARGRGTPRTATAPSPALTAAMERSAAALGIALPRLTVLLPSKHPILICRGLRKPIIVASTGLCEMLAPDELEAAIAHEMAHAKHRDPVLGWGLMLVRGLCFFNPAVQLAARAAVAEIERRADQSAARVVGSAEAVVASLRKLSGSAGIPAHTARTWHGFRLAAIEERCQALLREWPADPAGSVAVDPSNHGDWTRCHTLSHSRVTTMEPLPAQNSDPPSRDSRSRDRAQRGQRTGRWRTLAVLAGVALALRAGDAFPDGFPTCPAACILRKRGRGRGAHGPAPWQAPPGFAWPRAHRGRHSHHRQAHPGRRDCHARWRWQEPAHALPQPRRRASRHAATAPAFVSRDRGSARAWPFRLAQG